jgi:V/A-type H+-transporting ATPase subunit D
MTSLSRVPPGRAGRLWLRQRLASAERGLDLLERKLRILTIEHERRAREAERTEAEWTAACARADIWSLRAALTCGRSSFRPPTGPAEITVRWTHAMGTRYPDGATCALPPGPASLDTSAALARARTSCASALDAAVRHAAAREAERVLALEISATRQRIRALRNRWIPRLTAAIGAIDLALEETERADLICLLRAVPGEDDRRLGR